MSDLPFTIVSYLYFDYCRNCGMTYQTLKCKKSVIDSQLDPYFHPYKIDEVTEEIVFSFKEHILKQHFSKEYNIHIFSTLSCLFKFCVEKSLMERNVFYGYTTIFKETESCEFWTMGEFKKFISHFDLMYKTFYSLLFLTDIKQFEIRGLTIEDIDLSKGEITVHQRWYRRKRGKRERLIRLRDREIKTHKIEGSLVGLIRDYLTEKHCEIDEFLFPIKYTEVFTKKKEVCLKYNIREIKIHNLKDMKKRYVIG